MTGRRLVLVSHTAEVGGAELVLMRLASLALARGQEVTVCCPEGRLTGLVPDGAARVRIPPLTLGGGPRAVAAAGVLRRSVSAARVLRRVVTADDVVVANSLLALPAAAIAALPAPLVWLVHDVVQRRDWIAVLRLVRRHVDRVVAVSEAAAAPLRANGLPVVVVPHGVPWPIEPRAAEPVSPVVGCVGLLTPIKGHLVLMDAVATLDPPVTLELVGDVFPKDVGHVEQLRQRAARPDLAGRVRFLGRTDDVPAVMRGWTVAVSASTYPESGPLVVLEAMSLGIPVVATDIGGSAELLRDGSGVLVPPGSAEALATALHRLLADPEARQEYARRGLAQVAERHRQDVQLDLLLDAVLGE